jgi:hypothetical protein
VRLTRRRERPDAPRRIVAVRDVIGVAVDTVDISIARIETTRRSETGRAAAPGPAL